MMEGALIIALREAIRAILNVLTVMSLALNVLLTKNAHPVLLIML